MSTARDVAAELRSAGVSDVDDSDLARALYSTDASLYRVTPRVVVRPRHVDEVEAVLAVSRDTGVPVTSRGAGTSIAGNAVGTGIVIDFSRHLNRVLDIDAEAGLARVEPGVVHAVLQRQAVPTGWRYGPDPSTHTRCTVGGMIGNNACGNRALGYGRTADNIAGLTVLTPAGERLEVGRSITSTSPTLDRLREVVGANLGTIRTEFGRFGRQVSGYSLEHLLPENDFDVAAFFAGTEGTLGVISEAVVDLVREPAHRRLVVLGYSSMVAAAEHVTALLPFGPTALEGLGRRIVDVYQATKGPQSIPDLPIGGGLLYVEVAGDDPDELADRATKVARAAGAIDHRHVSDPVAQAVLWRIREEGAGLAGRALARPALSGWEDAAVPPEHLSAYLAQFTQLLDDFSLDGIPFGHFGDGCVHVRIDFPLDDDRARYRDFILAAAELTAAHHGSFSGEHGDGRARSELLPLMYSPDALAVFGQVKTVFDPLGLLNPGVLVDPAPIDADLRGQHRQWAPGLQRERRGLRLLHDQGSFGSAVHRCTGVGKCLADNTGGVMCPSFQATRDEKDSTRGRSRVLQEMVDGRLVSGWNAPEVHEALDLCLSCKGCASDCPTGVDMATYKSEVLYQSHRGRIRPRSHYLLGRLPFWARVISPMARLVNWSLRIPGLVHVARWSAGVDQRRSLPSFAPERFSKAARRRANSRGRRVLLWADSFTEFMNTEPGLATLDLLTSAGYSVELLERRACCGLTWITTGQLDRAAELVAEAVEQLHPYVSAGVPIVGVEPSCLAALRSDAVELVDDPRAAEVAGGVFTVAELLVREGWSAPDLSGVEVVVQPHCHQSSIIGFDADLELLARTGASVKRLSGCCGLAGNFGVEQGHYEVSVAVAETQLLPAVRDAAEGTVFLADGFSCRIQLDDLAGVQALHLSQLLTRDVTGPDLIRSDRLE